MKTNWRIAFAIIMAICIGLTIRVFRSRQATAPLRSAFDNPIFATKMIRFTGCSASDVGMVASVDREVMNRKVVSDPQILQLITFMNGPVPAGMTQDNTTAKHLLILGELDAITRNHLETPQAKQQIIDATLPFLKSNDKSHAEQLCALIICGTLNDPRVVPDVLPLVNSSVPKVAQFATGLLKHFGYNASGKHNEG